MATARTPSYGQPSAKYVGKGHNLPENPEKIMARPVAKKSKGNRQPPLWRRGAGIGKSAVWVEALGQYVISRDGKINLGYGSWRA